MVLTALSKHKLTLSAEKCIFYALSAEFVSFHLSVRWVTPFKSNMDAAVFSGGA